MPMLADLDHPVRSRTRDLLIGALCGLPLVGLLAWLLLPSLMSSMLGSAGDYDQRLRAEDAYMQGVCTQTFDLARDEQLCTCVLAVEFPALDCRQPFLRWSLERHQGRCGDAGVRKASLSFCSCIDTLAGRIAEAELAGESISADLQRVGKCLELPDAFTLPELTELVPAAP